MGCGGFYGHRGAGYLLEASMEAPAAQIGGGTRWEKSLAGDGFEGLRRAIGHELNSVVKNAELGRYEC